MSNFMDYKAQLGVLENNYMALVDKFVVAYPNLVSAAAFQLGDLFDRAEYPDAEKVKNKFKIAYNFLPVPMAGDFRVDINEDAKSEIMKSCEDAYNERLNNAMRDAWNRLHDCLTRMSDRLQYDEVMVVSDDPLTRRETVLKPRIFRDSLIENAMELTALLKHFNLTNDTNLEEARRSLADAIQNHDAESLRENYHAREVVKQKVDNILNKFNF